MSFHVKKALGGGIAALISAAMLFCTLPATASADDGYADTDARSSKNVEAGLRYLIELNQLRQSERTPLTTKQIADANGEEEWRIADNTAPGTPVPPLKYNADLMSWAQTRANELASKDQGLDEHANMTNGRPSWVGKYNLSESPNYKRVQQGNIIYGTTFFGPEALAWAYGFIPGYSAVQSWASELETGASAYGHYLTEVSPLANLGAIAVAQSKSGGIYTVLEVAYSASQPGQRPEDLLPKAKYTVTFESNGGSAVNSQTVNEDSAATEPDAPTKEGYQFAGWYTDKALSRKYDFSLPVKKNIILYAKWDKVTVQSVTAPADQTVPSGTQPTYPDTVAATYSDGSTGNAKVNWTRLTKNQYGARNGGTFTVNGTVDGYAQGVSFKVTVNAATMTGIDQPTAATVSKGTRPKTPATVKAHWSNGDTTDASVTWNTPDPNSAQFDEIKDYTFTGTAAGQQVTWKVTVAEAKVTKVYDPSQITVESGVTPVLPSTVKADFDNGQTQQDASVTWNALTEGDNAVWKGRKGGSFEVEGIVNGQSDQKTKIKVIVKPATIKDTVLPGITTAAGKVPTLPKTASITWSNGEVQNDVAITWNRIDASKYAKGSTFTATGSVTIDGVTGKVTVPVTVGAAAAIKAVAAQTTIDTIVTHAPDLSKVYATVTYTDGTTSTNKVQWNAIDASKYQSAGSFTVNGTVLKETASFRSTNGNEMADENGNALTVTVTVNVKAREITAVAPSTNPITIESGKTAPKVTGTATVTWNDGTTENRTIDLTLPKDWNKGIDEHAVTATGKTDGWKNDIQFTVTVSAAKAESVTNPAGITTTVGKKPVLPKQAVVTYSNGETVSRDVTWNAVSDSDFATDGATVTVNGTVQGLPVAVKVKVTKATIVSVDNPTGTYTTDAGKKPSSLPSTATAHLSDGATSNVAVTWKLDGVDFSNRTGKDRTVTVNGTADGWNGAVTVTVIVRSATVTKAEVDGSTSVTTDSGKAPKLPANAKITWSDGGAQTSEQIAWDKFTGYTKREGGSFTVNGTVRGQQVNVKVTVNPATPSKPQQDKVTTATTVGSQPSLPKTAKIVWSNGETTDETINWASYDSKQLDKPGTFDVTGKVTVPTDASGHAAGSKTFTITATVTVQAKPSNPGTNPGGNSGNSGNNSGPGNGSNNGGSNNNGGDHTGGQSETMVPVYRVYHQGIRQHLYTADANEYHVLTGQRGWNDEGIAFYVTNKAAGNKPVYRLYNKATKRHLVTLDRHERDVLVMERGWRQEGVAWYQSDEGAVPVYRLYSPVTDEHLYTTDYHEYQVNGTRGWRQEGIAWNSLK